MKYFIYELITLSFVVTIIFSFFLLIGDWSTDQFYYKVSSPKQSSLIIGSSRVTQALRPDILNEKLKRNDVFNYGFTMNHSPFGSTYFESIKHTIDSSSNDNIYIISVSPLMIMSKQKSE